MTLWIKYYIYYTLTDICIIIFVIIIHSAVIDSDGKHDRQSGHLLKVKYKVLNIMVIKVGGLYGYTGYKVLYFMNTKYMKRSLY